MAVITVRIENSYTDGHESTEDVEILSSPDNLSDEAIERWFEDYVFHHTGDGHYTEVYDATGERLGSCYIATVLRAPSVPGLEGRKYEWLD